MKRILFLLALVWLFGDSYAQTDLEALLSFLGFRIKEEAVLLHLSENTVMKYRSNIKKKVGFDPILALMS